MKEGKEKEKKVPVLTFEIVSNILKYYVFDLS
jgi:hypothetical protein